MRRNIASATRVSVLVPGPAEVIVLFVNLEFHLWTHLLHLIGHHDTGNTSANHDHLEWTLACVLQNVVSVAQRTMTISEVEHTLNLNSGMRYLDGPGTE